MVFDGSVDRLFIGGAERLQIEVRALDGTLLKLYRGPDAELLINEGFIAEYRRADLASADSASRSRLESADYPMPERYPAYSDLLLDPLGYIWVERFVLPWETERRWGIFDPDGVFLGHIHVPANLQITDVTEDHLVGITRDALDIPRIQVYRLDRAAWERGDTGPSPL